MPHETFKGAQQEHAEDPALEELYAELTRLESQTRFQEEALLARRERQAREKEHFDKSWYYHYGQKDGTWKKAVYEVKGREAAGAAVIAAGVAMLAGKETKKEAKKERVEKVASAPKPEKHVSKLVSPTAPELRGGIRPVAPEHAGSHADKAAKSSKAPEASLPKERIGKVPVLPEKKLPVSVEALTHTSVELPESPRFAHEPETVERLPIEKSSLSAGVDKVEVSPVAVPGVEQKVLHESDTIAPLSWTRSSTLSVSPEDVALSAKAVPEIHFENTTRAEKETIKPLEAAGKKKFSIKLDTVQAGAVEVPGVEFQREKDSVEKVPTAGAKQFETGVSGETHAVREVPKVPFSEGASAPVAQNKAEYPEGTLPPLPTEVRDDTTVFDFGEIGKPAPVTAPKKVDAPKLEKPAKKTEEAKGRGKMTVSLEDRFGKPIDPENPNKGEIVYTPPPAAKEKAVLAAIPAFAPAEEVRMDSVYYRPLKEAERDTALPKTIINIPADLAERHLKNRGDTTVIERVPLGDGTFLSRMYSGKAIDTAGIENMQWRAPDNVFKKVPGGFTVPSILEHRLDDTVLRKLETYGDLNATRTYFKQVEKNEDIGPWAIAVKSKGVLMIFDADNKLSAEFPFLSGENPGDSLNTYTTGGDPNGKTTPAGNYLLYAPKGKEKKEFNQLGHDKEKNPYILLLQITGGTLLNLGLALHGEVGVDKAVQEKNIHSAKTEDNDKTAGCIRVDQQAHLEKYLKGNAYYVLYVTPRDTKLDFNPETGELGKETTEKEKDQAIRSDIRKYTDENKVAYYVSAIELTEDSVGKGSFAYTTQRDPKAPQKIPVSKAALKPIKVPRFTKK